jgi:hypothetical protein
LVPLNSSCCSIHAGNICARGVKTERNREIAEQRPSTRPNHKNGKQEVSYCTKVRSYFVPGTLAGPSSLHAFIIHKDFQKELCVYVYTMSKRCIARHNSDRELIVILTHAPLLCILLNTSREKRFFYRRFRAQKWSARAAKTNQNNAEQ